MDDAPVLNPKPIKFDSPETSLRPLTLQQYVGQVEIKRNLKVFIDAARKRAQPLDHVLLCGPPGRGRRIGIDSHMHPKTGIPERTLPLGEYHLYVLRRRASPVMRGPNWPSGSA